MTQKELLRGLKMGKGYTLKSRITIEYGLYKNGQHRYFAPGYSLIRSDSVGGPYIAYSHYGSSAVKLNAKALSWLLKNIFECSANDFIEL